jgi:hypothetical protein
MTLRRLAQLDHWMTENVARCKCFCHRLCHARGIVHLHEFLIALKNQEDETDRREVINDDGVYI